MAAPEPTPAGAPAVESVRASFARWAYIHSALLLVATASAFWRGSADVVALIAAASFGALCVRAREHWTPAGSWGVANSVTAVRLCLSLGMLAFHTRFGGLALAGAALLGLVLDGVDGRLARRTGSASDFGALFDVETDALSVLTLSVVLLARGIAGPWVLIAGLWRYVYALLPLLIVPTGEDLRSLFGRVMYVVMVTSLILALFLPPPWAEPMAALGTLAVSASFGLSVWLRFRPRAA